MDRCRHVLQLALCSSLLWPPLSLGQDQTVPQDNAAKPQSPKEAKKREKKLSRELASQGGDWLRNIVPDIITEQERRAFLELGTDEDHITRDPCEKDALTDVPGAGLSLSELIGSSSRAGRFTNASGSTCPMPIGGTTASMNEFDVLDRYFRVQRPPERFKGMSELVTVTAVHNDIPMAYRADFLRVTSNTVPVPTPLQVP